MSWKDILKAERTIYKGGHQMFYMGLFNGRINSVLDVEDSDIVDIKIKYDKGVASIRGARGLEQSIEKLKEAYRKASPYLDSADTIEVTIEKRKDPLVERAREQNERNPRMGSGREVVDTLGEFDVERFRRDNM
tara:strand:+ start:381 stop:782 length:402 start_codon:yes stop_codon:yes gene_type:complete